MPDFTYRGAAPGLYPMLRDAYGVLAGTVTPGDVLEFDQAPDGDWVPCEAPGADASGKAAARTRPAAGTTAQQRDPGEHDTKAGVTGEEAGK